MRIFLSELDIIIPRPHHRELTQRKKHNHLEKLETATNIALRQITTQNVAPPKSMPQ